MTTRRLTPAAETTAKPPVLGYLSLAPLVADQFGSGYAIVAMPSVSPFHLDQILNRYGHRFGHFLIIPNISGPTMLWTTPRDFGGTLGLEISQNLLQSDAPDFQAGFRSSAGCGGWHRAYTGYLLPWQF